MVWLYVDVTFYSWLYLELPWFGQLTFVRHRILCILDRLRAIREPGS
jgi:hypothetical protein